MFDVFRKYITGKASFSKKEIELIKAASKTRRLRRGEFLLQEGEVCRNYAFVTKGCLRFYRVHEDKTEHIIRFAIENWWISDLESLELQQPSKCNIEALENAEVLLWAKEEMERVKRDVPAFKAVLEQLTARYQYASLDRIYTSMSHTSEEKYEKFINTYPDVFNRVPLHMIASYLGVSRKTLTRIRAQHTNPGGSNDLVK